MCLICTCHRLLLLFWWKKFEVSFSSHKISLYSPRFAGVTVNNLHNETVLFTFRRGYGHFKFVILEPCDKGIKFYLEKTLKIVQYHPTWWSREIWCMRSLRFSTLQYNSVMNKQTNYILFQILIYLQAPGLHTTQYYNVYKKFLPYCNDDNKKDYKNYLQRGCLVVNHVKYDDSQGKPWLESKPLLRMPII